jgi:hypothetical protein
MIGVSGHIVKSHLCAYSHAIDAPRQNDDNACQPGSIEGDAVDWQERYRLGFSWSHSRAELFEECQRRYYYRYYAPYGGNTPAETANRALLYRLGHLTSIPALVGSIVHDLARDALRRAQAGHLWPPTSYEASARALLSRALHASRKAAARLAAGEELRGSRLAALLDVHYLRQPFGTAEEEAALERVALYARALRDHPTFQEALTHADDLLSVDRFDRFTVLDVAVFAVPDAVQRRAEGRLRLIDWKTGAHVPEHLSRHARQLGVYALYAQKKWGVAAAQLECQVAELHSGAALAVPLDEETLRRTEAHIAASILAMRAPLRDAARNVAHSDDFLPLAAPHTPRQERPSACGGCPFQALCYAATEEG